VRDTDRKLLGDFGLIMTGASARVLGNRLSMLFGRGWPFWLLLLAALFATAGFFFDVFQGMFRLVDATRAFTQHIDYRTDTQIRF